MPTPGASVTPPFKTALHSRASRYSSPGMRQAIDNGWRLGAAGRILVAALVAASLFATAALADSDTFKGYRKSDPKRFHAGVVAYDAHDFPKAYKIWLPLAQHGDIAAMFNVALMLRDGRGIRRDPAKALAYFRQAATMGHLGSEVDLADMYMRGEGTKQNYLEAARWLLVAARRGHLPSAYKLGLMCEKGIGMPVDLKAARAFYLFAARRGYELAATRLAILANQTHASSANPPSGPRAPPDQAFADENGPLPEPRPWRVPSDATDTSLFHLRGSLSSRSGTSLNLPPSLLMRLRPSSGGDSRPPGPRAFKDRPTR
jgi:hypothetical protein